MESVAKIDTMNAENHSSIKLPWFSLLITGTALGLLLLFGSAPEYLVYDRLAIAQGEWWRLITGHLVHSDIAHAQWDILAFAMIAALLEQIDRKGLALTCLVSIVIINIWIGFGMPNLLHYAGLSGIINAIFTLLLYRLWLQKPNGLILVIATGAAFKLAIGLFTGQILFTDTFWPSVPSVHLAGVASAALYILTERANNKWKAAKKQKQQPGHKVYRTLT